MTGFAALTPAGSLSHGSCGIDWGAPCGPHRVSRFDARDFPVRSAAEVSCEDETALGLDAARMALGGPRAWRGRYPRGDVGVFLGVEPARLVLGATHDGNRSPARVTDAVAAFADAEGPRRTFSMACVASATAIAAAARAVANGEVAAAIAGGVALNVEPLLFAAFCHLGTLSVSGACRPFDARRDGFVLADGAGVVVLERDEHVRATGRGDEVMGSITGIGESLDAFRMTDREPDGRGARDAVRAALEDAEMSPDDVALVKAHATGTEKNDSIEARLIHDIFGNRPQVLALKGRLGHCIAASGAVEAIVALDALRRGVVPGVGTLERFDASLPPVRVTNGAAEIHGRVALCNTFGFGGLNCALVVAV